MNNPDVAAEVRRIFPDASDDDVAQIVAAKDGEMEKEAAKAFNISPLELSAAAFAMRDHPIHGRRSFTELVKGIAHHVIHHHHSDWHLGDRLDGNADLVPIYEAGRAGRSS